MTRMIHSKAAFDAATVPRHVAIIMDGNGRWAKKRMLPRAAGHRKGAEAVRTCVKNCGELGIGYLTLYAFSSENWKRPADEVADLMGLLRLYLRQELADLHKQDVRLRFIGGRDRLSDETLELIDQAESITRDNNGLHMIIALNYGSQLEIVEAAKAIAEDIKTGKVCSESLTEQVFGSYLLTDGIPNPDMIIRTSGEQRLSNFMLWQAAYAELVFQDVLWPDFDRSHLEAAIAEFQQRERRYGAR